jgi:mono/diheme cytochrome c family protein
MSKNTYTKPAAATAAIYIAALLIGTSSAAERTTKVAPQVPPAFNIGKLLYGKFCSSCHGVDLKGTEQGPPFLHRVYHPGHHGDGSFILAAKRGVKAHHWKFGNMPPVEGVDDNMINAIVQYIRKVQKSAGLF